MSFVVVVVVVFRAETPPVSVTSCGDCYTEPDVLILEWLFVDTPSIPIPPPLPIPQNTIGHRKKKRKKKKKRKEKKRSEVTWCLLYRERAETAAVSRATSHVTVTTKQCTTSVDIRYSIRVEKGYSLIQNHMREECSEPARGRKTVLYKNDQQQQPWTGLAQW